jgi:uncharacterized iron-regulated membrane protein
MSLRYPTRGVANRRAVCAATPRYLGRRAALSLFEGSPREPVSELGRLGKQGAHPRRRLEKKMLVALAVILLVIALAGGIAVNPLLFLIALLALVVFFGGGRRGSVY